MIRLRAKDFAHIGKQQSRQEERMKVFLREVEEPIWMINDAMVTSDNKLSDDR